MVFVVCILNHYVAFFAELDDEGLLPSTSTSHGGDQFNTPGGKIQRVRGVPRKSFERGSFLKIFVIIHFSHLFAESDDEGHPSITDSGKKRKREIEHHQSQIEKYSRT